MEGLTSGTACIQEWCGRMQDVTLPAFAILFTLINQLKDALLLRDAGDVAASVERHRCTGKLDTTLGRVSRHSHKRFDSLEKRARGEKQLCS
jgi:hypothetical protein